MCGVYGKRGKWGLRVAATLYEYVTVWLGNSVASIAKAYRKSCGQVLIHMLADTKSVDFQATRGSGAVDIRVNTATEPLITLLPSDAFGVF